ncbi:MAG: hypothetical protein KME55_30500 [Nostoc indistinguendum CM1-VF10]|jgi:hypothetical protein|nr:hypothetical protein [Nostoc indistinguendum CM1-VF10]
MLQMQCECSTQKPLWANGGFMSRAQREMAQPPAGHETIVSMYGITYTKPRNPLLGEKSPLLPGAKIRPKAPLGGIMTVV